ncbi:MAG TPA: hypothetical protein VNN74_05420 [Candidatus Micrarchaeia archaeon]|nr:hypothetical protein [Candidatus Micrarchaeia archaeon]
MLWTWPLWASPGNLIPAGRWPPIYYTDANTFIWYLAWVPHAISSGASPYVTHLLNYPAGASLAYPGPPLLWTTLLWPVTVWAGVVSGYDAWIVMAMVANGVAGCIALGRWVRHGWVAVAGGILFAFSPYAVGEAMVGHPNLLAVPTIPLAALLLHETLVRQRWRARTVGLGWGALLALQLLTAEEVAVMIVLVGGIAATGLAAAHPGQVRRRVRHVAGAALWALPPVVPVVALLGWYQLLAPGSIHGKLYAGGLFSMDPKAIFLPDIYSGVTLPAITAFLTHHTPLPTEGVATVGIPLAIVLACLGRHPDPLTRLLLPLVAILVVLSLGPSLHLVGLPFSVPLPEAALSHLPILQDLVPDRLAGVLDFLLILSLATFSERLLVRTDPRGWWLVAAAAALSWMPLVPAPTQHAGEPALFRSSLLTGKVVLVYPFAQDGFGAASERWQAVGGLRFALTGGYYQRTAAVGGAFPYGPPATPLTDALYSILKEGGRPRATAALRRSTRHYLDVHHVNVVVVGPGTHWRRAATLMATLLHRPPTFELGADVWPIRPRPSWHAVPP